MEIQGGPEIPYAYFVDSESVQMLFKTTAVVLYTLQCTVQ